MLPNLGNKKSEEFIHSVDFFLRYIPILIFLVVPFYPFIFSIWLGDQYTSTIHDLAKIFSLVAILSGTSHILVTKFEANQISKLNFKIEIILLPIFLIILLYLCARSYSLIYISTLILSKELIFIFLRIYFLKLEKKKIRFFYLNLIMFTLLLILSFINMDLYYVTLVLIIFYTYIDVKLYN